MPISINIIILILFLVESNGFCFNICKSFSNGFCIEWRLIVVLSSSKKIWNRHFISMLMVFLPFLLTWNSVTCTYPGGSQQQKWDLTFLIIKSFVQHAMYISTSKIRNFWNDEPPIIDLFFMNANIFFVQLFLQNFLHCETGDVIEHYVLLALVATVVEEELLQEGTLDWNLKTVFFSFFTVHLAANRFLG
jgi:hypothetical protein